MNGGSQSGLGGIALADALQNTLDITEAIGIVDVRDGSQGFCVGDMGLNARQVHETAFQGVQGNIAVRLEEQGKLVSFIQVAGFQELGDAFVQPGGAATAGKLSNKGMSQFMFQNVGDRDSQLAVIDRARPGGCVGDIEESLLGIQSDEDVIARRAAKIANQVIIVGFEGGDDLGAKGFGSLPALIVQSEMDALPLGEVSLDGLFALASKFWTAESGRNSRERFQEATASLVWSEANWAYPSMV